MFETFRKSIKFYYDLGIAVWSYKTPQFDGDIPGSIEDYSHGMLDVAAAIVGYENGLAFTLEDIDTLTGTFETIMYRAPESNPRLSTNVYGDGESSGAICGSGFEMSVYGNQLNAERGMRFRINQGAKACQDAPWALAFHADTPTPKSFSLTSPSNGEEYVDPDCAAFMWQRSPYANYYKLQISDDSEFNNIIVNRDKIIDSSVIVTSLPENAELYYRVVAVNMKGEETVSDTCFFKTADQNTVNE